MNKKTKISVLFALLASACYGVSSPISKILLNEIPPIFMASLLYLGAGFGMMIINLLTKSTHQNSKEAKMTKKELPYILGMIFLDIAAPILLMFGLTMSPSENVSLLNNFEIVATSLIALFIFKEAIGKRMWLAIMLITASSIILTFKNISSLSFSFGSLFVLLACLCWGFENNCTRMLSSKNPIEIVIVKGIGAGSMALIMAFTVKEYSYNLLYIICTLLLGFFAYGLSIFFYILAQRELGASRTSVYYAVAPFIGVSLSFVVFRQPIPIAFVVALLFMLAGTYFAAFERHKHQHIHESLEHDHRHNHSDEHHNHLHDIFIKEHSHRHIHQSLTHDHHHTPDIHHAHFH